MKPQRGPDLVKTLADDGAKEHLGRTARRRLYVTLYVLVLVLLYPFLYENLGTLATLAFLFISPLYYSRSAIVAAYRKGRMDERERQVAFESFKIAYEILVVTLLVSLAVSAYPPPEWLAGAARYFLFTPSVLFDFGTVLLLALVLPASVVAWLEPDPIPEN